VAQKANTAQQSCDAIHSAVALPVDAILNDAVNVMEGYIGHSPEVVDRLRRILQNARDIKQTIQQSHISAVDKYQGPPNVEVAGTPVQGRSGGGLFDADGRVIGVCNASDPRDNEGIFAALASVHEELVSAGLAAVFNAPAENAIVSATSTRTPSRRQPPPMPENMPRTLPVQPDGPLETSLQGLANSESNDSGMTPAEIATLKELVGRAGSAEVICIIRPHHPDGQSEIVVLDEASPEFVRKLAEIQGRTERR